MNDVKWIKIVTDIFEDEKILMIEKLPRADAILIIWFKLLCLAGKNNNGGKLALNDSMPYTYEMFSTVFRRPVSLIKTALQTFLSFGMIEMEGSTVVITNWEKHQNVYKLEKIKEQSRKRSAKYRKSQKTENESVTRHVTKTEPVTQNHAVEKEKELELELEDAVAVEEEYFDDDDDGSNDSRQNEIKLLYGKIGKGVVMLSDNQFDDICDKLGLDEINYYVAKLADFIIDHGAKVKNHYATILRWAEEDKRVNL